MNKPDSLADRLLATARELRYQPANGRYARKWEQIRRLERMAEQARRVKRPKRDTFDLPF